MTDLRTPEETKRLGEAIYERDIRAHVEADHHGEFVAIDVESGCWALSDNRRAATMDVRAQQPDAVDVWLLRVGHSAATYRGGRPLRDAE